MRSIELRDCCYFLSGGTPTKANADYWKGSIPWYSPKDIKTFELIDSQDHISEAAVDSSATRKINPGTILVVGRSGILAHTFPVGVVRQSATFNQDIKAIVPMTGYDSEFLALFLKSQESLVLSTGVKIGPTVHSLRTGFIEALTIPVIDLHDQIRFGTQLKSQLTAVQEAREAARAQLSEVRRLKTQALHQIFSNIKATSAIGEVARVQSGYAFKSQTFQKHGVRLLRNANISPGRVYWDDAVFLMLTEAASFGSYELHEGNVLISLDRPIISSGIKVARVSAVDLPALLVQRVGRFQIDETRLNPDYLYAYLQTHAFIEAITGHEQSLGVPHISPGQIEKIEIPLPDIDEQKRLAKILIDIANYTSEAQAAAERQLRDIELLPSRLLAHAFDKLNLQVAEHG